MKQPIKDNCLLKQVEKLELNCKEFGFYWETFSQLMEQIQSECVEIEEAWKNQDRPHVQEEIGDLIQAAVSLAIFCKLDPHETLSKSIQKCQKRVDVLMSLAKADGHENLHNQPFEILMSYWDRAKKLTTN